MIQIGPEALIQPESLDLAVAEPDELGFAI
jgi:hypothetical protein